MAERKGTLEKMVNEKNILVLGGNGYLGSKVVDRLIFEGYKVVCTKRANSSVHRVQHSSEIEWIFATEIDIENAMKNNRFYCVVNLVCKYGRESELYDDVLEANIEFPLKVLDLAVRYKIKHFITIGTGLPTNFNFYSVSKNLFNEFGKFYSNNYSIDFSSIKLEMFYGGDEPRDRFLPSVIEKMIKGDTVDVTLGTQHRDIVLVNDVVDAILLVIKNIPNGYSEIPVGTGYAPRISEIIDFIWEKCEKKSVVNKGIIPMRKNEPDCVADTSKIKEIGDWTPVKWETGIALMIDEIKKDIMENTDENID